MSHLAKVVRRSTATVKVHTFCSPRLSGLNWVPSRKKSSVLDTKAQVFTISLLIQEALVLEEEGEEVGRKVLTSCCM